MNVFFPYFTQEKEKIYIYDISIPKLAREFFRGRGVWGGGG